MSNIRIKRIYDDIEEGDGYRILVDRLWPRGLSKEKAKVDQWLKQVAPSNELRKWYSHDRDKWTEFKRRYLEELHSMEEGALQELKMHIGRERRVTFLFSSKELTYNNASALKFFFDEGLI